MLREGGRGALKGCLYGLFDAVRELTRKVRENLKKGLLWRLSGPGGVKGNLEKVVGEGGEVGNLESHPEKPDRGGGSEKLGEGELHDGTVGTVRPYPTIEDVIGDTKAFYPHLYHRSGERERGVLNNKGDLRGEVIQLDNGGRNPTGGRGVKKGSHLPVEKRVEKMVPQA